ncbi:MAG: TRAP transporter small permease [Desulfobacteraceae bacterium]|jgi:TRAP-type C4-dicarboxylate transport system permease small subunit
METLSRWTNQAAKIAAGALTGAMALLVFLQVIFRYLLDAPLDWSEEMSTFAFAWMALLGASVGLKRDEHPRLDIFFVLFPPALQQAARVLINAAVIFMLGVLLVYGWKLTLVMKMQHTAALNYSVSFVYAVLPASALIMLIHALTETVSLFRRKERPGP